MKCDTIRHSWIYEEELGQVAETLNKWFTSYLYFFPFSLFSHISNCLSKLEIKPSMSASSITI